ncbi:MAG: hypothetical protein ACLU9S_23900 [Oscillospiraceae bacterium]
MHRDFQGFALENEGIFHFGMPLAGCGGLWYSVLSESGMDVLSRQLGSFADTTSIPASDGNPFLSLRISLRFPDTTYPRKGTETASFPKWLEFQKGHNLSPQGDEEGNTGAPSTTL